MKGESTKPREGRKHGVPIWRSQSGDLRAAQRGGGIALRAYQAQLGAGHFLLRGLDGVRAEMSLLATAFNAARLITLKGVEFLVALGGKGQIQSLPAAA